MRRPACKTKEVVQLHFLIGWKGLKYAALCYRAPGELPGQGDKGVGGLHREESWEQVETWRGWWVELLVRHVCPFAVEEFSRVLAISSRLRPLRHGGKGFILRSKVSSKKKKEGRRRRLLSQSCSQTTTWCIDRAIHKKRRVGLSHLVGARGHKSR